MITPSKKQLDILNAWQFEDHNIVISAVAGSGN